MLFPAALWDQDMVNPTGEHQYKRRDPENLCIIRVNEGTNLIMELHEKKKGDRVDCPLFPFLLLLGLNAFQTILDSSRSLPAPGFPWG